MKRIFISILAVLVSSAALLAQDSSNQNSESNKFPFAIKAYPFRGMYLDKNTHFEKFGAIYPAGVHMGLEFPSTTQRPWQQYLGNPTVGLGVSWIDFGNPTNPDVAKVGMGVAVYPYILLDAIDTEHFQMRFKIAGGAGFVTEHWYTQEDQNPDNYYEPSVNTIFGCTLNAYLNAGINLNVPITRYLALGGEFGYIHMSNGRTCMPNIGINSLYGSVGVTATFNSDVEKKPVQFPDQPYGWAINITGAAGAQKSAIADKNRFLISSFHAGAVYHVTNWYGVGLGLDVFYNDAVTKFTDRSLYCKGEYDIDEVIVDCTTCGDSKDVDYTFAQKVRSGIALNNEFKFGAVTAIVDWGMYFYNPSRHIYLDYHKDNYGKVVPKRELAYVSPWGAGAEEAFHYIRLGAKCRIWDNLYAQMTMKCHLHIAEFIEFGLGYQIPFLKKENRKEGKSIVFHHRRNWWKE
jgi:hypothetical protein